MHEKSSLRIGKETPQNGVDLEKLKTFAGQLSHLLVNKISVKDYYLVVHQKRRSQRWLT